MGKSNSNQNTISNSPVQTFIWISRYLEELFFLVVTHPLHLFKGSTYRESTVLFFFFFWIEELFHIKELSLLEIGFFLYMLYALN